MKVSNQDCEMVRGRQQRGHSHHRRIKRLLHTLVMCLLLAARVSAQGSEAGVIRRAQVYEPYLMEVAKRYEVDPRLLWTIAYLETRFRPQLVSLRGARGMMQFMPATARALGLRNPHDPWASLEAAARYVRMLSQRFKRPELVLAAYNAGDTAVEAYTTGRAIPAGPKKVINPRRVRTGGVPPYAETRDYVARGLEVLAQLPTSSGRVGSLRAETAEKRDLERRGIYVTEPEAGTTVSASAELERAGREGEGANLTNALPIMPTLHTPDPGDPSVPAQAPIKIVADRVRKPQARSVYFNRVNDEENR